MLSSNPLPCTACTTRDLTNDAEKYNFCHECGRNLQKCQTLAISTSHPSAAHQILSISNADLDSMLDQQLSHLWSKETETANKIRFSKHTCKYLSEYLELRSAIEFRYTHELTQLLQQFTCEEKFNTPQTSESPLILSLWTINMKSDLKIIDERSKFAMKLYKISSKMNDTYEVFKKDEQNMRSTIILNEKKLNESQKKFEKIVAEISKIEHEISKMDEIRLNRNKSNENDERFTAKELQKLKQFRNKLSDLQSKEIEFGTHHWRSRNTWNKEMANIMRNFLSDQITHLYSTQTLYLNISNLYSELRAQNNAIENSKCKEMSILSPIQDLINFVAVINAEDINKYMVDGGGDNKYLLLLKKRSKSNISKIESTINSPWISLSNISMNNIVQKNIEQNKKSSVVLFVDKNVEIMPEMKKMHLQKNKIFRNIINNYWQQAFKIESDAQNALLNETAFDCKLNEIDGETNDHSMIDQLFPDNISYTIIDSFDLPDVQWNQFFWQLLMHISNTFSSIISPHISHIWKNLIPAQLNINKQYTQLLINMQLKKSKEWKMQSSFNVLLTDIKYFLFTIFHCSCANFDNNQRYYYSWLQQQLTYVSAVIAWKMNGNGDESWEVFLDENEMCEKNYLEIISNLNILCSKILLFTAHHPKLHPSENKHLLQFLQTVEQLLVQIDQRVIEEEKHNSLSSDMDSDSSEIKSISEEFIVLSDIMHGNASAKIIEEEKEYKIEDVSDLETEENKQRKKSSSTSLPTQISRFVLWYLIKYLVYKPNVMDEEKEITQIFGRTKRRKSLVDMFSFALPVKHLSDDQSSDTENVVTSDSTSDGSTSALLSPMLHSRVVYDGSLQQKSKQTQNMQLINDWKMYVDTFADGYCPVLHLRRSTPWIFMARLCINVVVEHSQSNLKGIEFLQTLKTVVESEMDVDGHSFDAQFVSHGDVKIGESFLSSSSASDADINQNVPKMKSEPFPLRSKKKKKKKSAKYHIHKKWTKLKNRINVDQNSNEKKRRKSLLNNMIHRKSETDNSKKNKPKTMVKPLKNNNGDEIFDGVIEQSLEEVLLQLCLNLNYAIKEDEEQHHSKNDNQQILKYIYEQIEKWLVYHMSYPISMSKNIFHIYIILQSVMHINFVQIAHNIQHILVSAANLKYESMFDSVLEIQKRRIRNSHLKQNETCSSDLTVDEWQMFSESIMNSIDRESQNTLPFFVENKIYAKVGQFVLLTLSHRFIKDFHGKALLKCLENQTENITEDNHSNDFLNIGNIAVPKKSFNCLQIKVENKFIFLCNIDRKFHKKILEFKHILFPIPSLHPSSSSSPSKSPTNLKFSPTFSSTFPSPDLIPLQCLSNILKHRQPIILNEWLQPLLTKEDWIGINSSKHFYANSVLLLHYGLNLMVNTFFTTFHKLRLHILLPSERVEHNLDDKGISHAIAKMRQLLVHLTTNCIDYYTNYIMLISGNIKDIQPESENITELNLKNRRKSELFNTKEIFRKTKKSLKKESRSPSNFMTDKKDENVSALLYDQKLEELCTRYECIHELIIITKKLNTKLHQSWNTNNTKIESGSHLKWLNTSIDNIFTCVDRMSNLIASYVIFIDLRLDIVDNLYSSKPAINNDESEAVEHQILRKNGRIVENCETLQIWSKLKQLFENKLYPNLNTNNILFVSRKIFALYLLSLRWILLHSNKDRKFDVADYRVIMQDMIGMSKFWKSYLSSEIMMDMRRLSQIDIILDLMKQPTEVLIQQFEDGQPFVTDFSFRVSREADILPIISLEKLNHFRTMHVDVNSNLNSASVSNFKSIFFDCNDKQFQRICCCSEIQNILFPYVISTIHELIIHVLVRRIEKQSQKFVNEKMLLLQKTVGKKLKADDILVEKEEKLVLKEKMVSTAVNSDGGSGNHKKSTKTKDDRKSDSDSFHTV